MMLFFRATVWFQFRNGKSNAVEKVPKLIRQNRSHRLCHRLINPVLCRRPPSALHRLGYMYDLPQNPPELQVQSRWLPDT